MVCAKNVTKQYVTKQYITKWYVTKRYVMKWYITNGTLQNGTLQNGRLQNGTEAVFRDIKPRIINARLFQWEQLSWFALVWIKWSWWRNLLPHCYPPLFVSRTSFFLIVKIADVLCWLKMFITSLRKGLFILILIRFDIYHTYALKAYLNQGLVNKHRNVRTALGLKKNWKI